MLKGKAKSKQIAKTGDRMKISTILKDEKIKISFEVFPPKKESSYESVESATREIADLKPSYMSVTYGAGGGTSKYTVNIAADLQRTKQVTALAHLSCISLPKENIVPMLDNLKEHGIENILALRGDIPKEGQAEFEHYQYASELVEVIKSYGGFCIGGACYPEGHPESSNKKEDILNLKKKVDAGCEFLTTQMFFDNNVFYNFLYRARERDIKVPIIPGIMPITRANQVERVCQMSGTIMPARFLAIVDRFKDNPAAMKQAGIVYASDQIIDLIANGINNIHVYTMNQPDVAAGILRNLSEILK